MVREVVVYPDAIVFVDELHPPLDAVKGGQRLDRYRGLDARVFGSGDRGESIACVVLLSALGVSLALAIVRSLLSGLQNLTDITVSQSLPSRRQWPHGALALTGVHNLWWSWG